MNKEVYTKEEAKYLKVGLYVSVVLILIAVGFAYLQRGLGRVDSGKSYTVTASFNRTDGLLVGDLVRMAGMDIGRVVDAKFDDHFKAVLTFELKDKIKIPDDSSASIVSSSLMGSKYIEIEPGGSEDMIKPGGAFAYTQDAMVVEELLDRIVGIGKAKRGIPQNVDSSDMFDLDE